MARKTPGAARGTQMFTKLANGASTEFDLISATLREIARNYLMKEQNDCAAQDLVVLDPRWEVGSRKLGFTVVCACVVSNSERGRPVGGRMVRCSLGSSACSGRWRWATGAK